MSGLDAFALVVLLILAATAVGIWAALGMMPGRIARERNHPQVDAINICGWFGVITMGILCPVAFIWAYSTPSGMQEGVQEGSGGSPNEVESEPEPQS